MTTDIERELRELFREKAGEAPLATFNAPTAAPQEVLRRGRRHQVGTVIGSAAIVLVLIVGSVAGLNTLLRGDDDPFTTGQYEIFERTATIEAFTVTSPSDWFLVNEWPLSTQLAVGSGSSSGECAAAAPGEGQPSPVCSETTQSPQVEELAYGLPILQLSNVDLGLGSVACKEEGLPRGAATLFVTLYDTPIGGFKAPRIDPFSPNGALPRFRRDRVAPDTMPSSPSTIATSCRGSVSATSVTDADRATALAAYQSLTVDDGWEPEAAEQDHSRVRDRRGRIRTRRRLAPGAAPGRDRPRALARTTGQAPTVLLTDELRRTPGVDRRRPDLRCHHEAATGVEFRPGAGNVDSDPGQSPVAGTIMPTPANAQLVRLRPLLHRHGRRATGSSADEWSRSASTSRPRLPRRRPPPSRRQMSCPFPAGTRNTTWSRAILRGLRRRNRMHPGPPGCRGFPIRYVRGPRRPSGTPSPDRSRPCMAGSLRTTCSPGLCPRRSPTSDSSTTDGQASIRELQCTDGAGRMDGEEGLRRSHSHRRDRARCSTSTPTVRSCSRRATRGTARQREHPRRSTRSTVGPTGPCIRRGAEPQVSPEADSVSAPAAGGVRDRDFSWGPLLR